jgi:hypothetical protein
MAKIENEPEKALILHRYQVTNSFDGLNRGDTFTQEPDQWADLRVTAGYLRDLGEVWPDVGR